MNNFITKHKSIVIFSVIAILILAAAYIWGGNPSTPASNVGPEYSSSFPTDENICKISIRCDDVLANAEALNPDKIEIIPEDGIILPITDISFTPEETVFDALKKATHENNIYLDFSMTPGAYIKGIGNLYEKDCGSMSGWIVYINGESPTIACSDIKINPGDVIEWVYICDFSKLY